MALVIDQVDEGAPALGLVEPAEPLEASIDPGPGHRLLADVLAADQPDRRVRALFEGLLQTLRVLALAADVNCRNPFTSWPPSEGLRLA